MPAALQLSRDQILGHRRRVGQLDRRLPMSPESLRQAAWAGLQDSMPRAALLSIHARVTGTQPSTWEDPSLIQVWGPRFSAFVVAAADRAVFTLGRLPDDPARRRRAETMASRLDDFLAGRRMPYGDAGHAMGIHPNLLRYGTATGRILIRWDGARQPVVWTVAQPDVDPSQARLELARRYLRSFGPGTAASFGEWAGLRPAGARAAFDGLAAELTAARTPIGERWILSSDEPSFRADPDPPAPARLLPSGDAHYLVWGADRELVVPDAGRRPELWTPRVWPGAILVDGEVAGTWSRSNTDVALSPWRRFTSAERDALRAEAESFPVPAPGGAIRVRWSG